MTFSVSKITLYSIRNWAAFSVKGPNRISKIIQFQKRTLPDNTVALCYGLRVWTRLLSLDWDQPRWKNLVQKSGPTKAIKSFLLQPESSYQTRSSNETPFASELIVELSFKIVQLSTIQGGGVFAECIRIIHFHPISTDTTVNQPVIYLDMNKIIILAKQWPFFANSDKRKKA